jgi:hypothetical protein
VVVAQAAVLDHMAMPIMAEDLTEMETTKISIIIEA